MFVCPLYPAVAVSAFSTADVEQKVIAEALEEEKEQKRAETTKRSAAAAASPYTAANASANARLAAMLGKRKRIPRKEAPIASSSSTTPGLTSSSSSFSSSARGVQTLPPVPEYRRTTHFDDPSQPKGKSLTAEAMAVRRRVAALKAGKDAASSSSKSRLKVEDSKDDDGPDAPSIRQQLIDRGAITPFQAMTGFESHSPTDSDIQAQ